MPFIRWNCAACPPDLVESELFGHEPGAFTGATRRRLGRFEQADGGTLFLDEIGQMPMPVQEKVLRIVEYGAFERVGGEETIQTDVRIVAATNADLPRACREGRFREDLLDRLAFMVVHMPPLRDRGDDIPLLAAHFAARMSAELGRTAAPEIDSRSERTLRAHSWPGNIRELRNVVERAVVHSREARLGAIDLDPFRQAPQVSGEAPNWETAVDRLSIPLDLSAFVEKVRRRFLDRALRESSFHQRRAAAMLGLTYHQFRALYRKCELPKRKEVTVRARNDGAP
jgi:psp operon transcriptional activator